MPVIVVGADTPFGSAVIEALIPRDGEVRAFVTDVETAAALRERGVKVALGDVSDGSHVWTAASRAFSAVTVVEAAVDGRERSFAAPGRPITEGWADGLRRAGVKRVIVVGDDEELIVPLRKAAPEVAVVAAEGRDLDDIGTEVAGLDAAAQLPGTDGAG